MSWYELSESSHQSLQIQCERCSVLGHSTFSCPLRPYEHDYSTGSIESNREEFYESAEYNSKWGISNFNYQNEDFPRDFYEHENFEEDQGGYQNHYDLQNSNAYQESSSQSQSFEDFIKTSLMEMNDNTRRITAKISKARSDLKEIATFEDSHFHIDETSNSEETCQQNMNPPEFEATQILVKTKSVDQNGQKLDELKSSIITVQVSKDEKYEIPQVVSKNSWEAETLESDVEMEVEHKFKHWRKPSDEAEQELETSPMLVRDSVIKTDQKFLTVIVIGLVLYHKQHLLDIQREYKPIVQWNFWILFEVENRSRGEINGTIEPYALEISCKILRKLLKIEWKEILSQTNKVHSSRQIRFYWVVIIIKEMFPNGLFERCTISNMGFNVKIHILEISYKQPPKQSDEVNGEAKFPKE